MKSQKIKSQKLHEPILETNRKNLHPQKNPVIRYITADVSISLTIPVLFSEGFLHPKSFVTYIFCKTSILSDIHIIYD